MSIKTQYFNYKQLIIATLFNPMQLNNTPPPLRLDKPYLEHLVQQVLV